MSANAPQHTIGLNSLDPERWLEQHGDVLFRYALARLREPAAAEDVVQETLVAAWKGRSQFAGQAAERTWLVGILRHKILDALRRRHREPEQVSLAAEESSEPPGLFDEHGHWNMTDQQGPREWSETAAQAVQRQEFWGVLDGCLEKLPPRAAQAFVLRELDGTETGEICKVLGVSATNLWVLLHRARVQLRHCLERNWFGP